MLGVPSERKMAITHLPKVTSKDEWWDGRSAPGTGA
jgi:hypothetical protein